MRKKILFYLSFFMLFMNVVQPSADAAYSGKIRNENVQIRHVKVLGSGGRYTVTGQVKVGEGTYFYTVEDGHNVLIPEKTLAKKADKSKWLPFKVKINLAKEQLPPNGTIIFYAYERDAQGKIVHAYSIVLEKFYH
ncbi:Gmad2 immunoglobulin-like domain-containing protein [Neobacillus sp. SM06]|uniref:Gmad2 immunoglobulin-like domain-containing protein n=1 Tax=Neobacillus sp. SM06 TaxID=3422492 RepID=UPI003D2DF4BC